MIENHKAVSRAANEYRPQYKATQFLLEGCNCKMCKNYKDEKISHIQNSKDNHPNSSKRLTLVIQKNEIHPRSLIMNS